MRKSERRSRFKSVALGDSRQIEAMLLEHMPAAVVVGDEAQRVVYCNQAARALYGCAPGEPLPEVLTDTTDATEGWEGELTVGGRTVHCNAQPVRDSAGRRVGTMTVSVAHGGNGTTTNLREIGRRIASARTAAGLTQQQLADSLGVTRRSVQGYESGSVAPFRHVRRLSELLGRPAGWFLLDEPAADDEPLREVLRRIVREEVAALR